MRSRSVRSGRRDFLVLGVLAAASGALTLGASGSRAQPARLDEKDSTAQNLGYRHDATKVDAKKFSRFQPGQTCANCMVYQGKAGDAWGGCPIYGGKLVNAKGWCNAYVKKT
jgi:hypothetical protein